jgi:hypothetical protein
VIVLDKSDFSAAEKYSQEQTTPEELNGITRIRVTVNGDECLHLAPEGVREMLRVAYIAGLNYATIKMEKASKKRRGVV